MRWHAGQGAQAVAWALTCVLVAFAPPGVCAFSLPAAAPTPRHGRQATDDARCATSCDETPDDACDQMDDKGDYTLGCDRHPTTSCDDFSRCTSPPAPPARPPWQGDGTYPYPPPHPPPPSPPREMMWWGIGPAVLAVALVIALLCCCCCARDGRARNCCWKQCPFCIGCLFCDDRERYVKQPDGKIETVVHAFSESSSAQDEAGLSDASLRAVAQAEVPMLALPLATSLRAPM